MVGMGSVSGRYGVLGVGSADPVLSLVSALGLAQAAGTALVVDLCGDLAIESGRTIADIAADGPSLGELSPGRPGVALIRSGPLHLSECGAVVEALAPNWPAIVVRCHLGDWDGPTVPVRGLLPGLLRTSEQGAAVWQPFTSGLRPTGPGPVMPRLRGSLVRRMLAGRSTERAKWVRAWDRVWELPWA
jgi:hypothetical protein